LHLRSEHHFLFEEQSSIDLHGADRDLASAPSFSAIAQELFQRIERLLRKAIQRKVLRDDGKRPVVIADVEMTQQITDVLLVAKLRIPAADAARAIAAFSRPSYPYAATSLRAL
jgi:hypothetical protein